MLKKDTWKEKRLPLGEMRLSALQDFEKAMVSVRISDLEPGSERKAAWVL